MRIKHLFIFISCSVMLMLKSEVIFVPGWLNKDTFCQNYAARLQKIYPDEKITVMSWESGINWNDAIENAENFAPKLAEYISEKSADEQNSIILAGHSLGGRIAVNAAAILAAEKIRIKEMILLGCAMDYDSDLSAVSAAADCCINIFSRNDSVLKYMYNNWERGMALGFCGASSPPEERFVQYEMVTSELPVSGTSTNTALWEMLNHLAMIYLNELEAAVRNQRTPWQKRFDYSRVEIDRTMFSLPDWLTLPPFFKMEIIDSYAQWTFASVTLPKYTHARQDGSRKEYGVDIYLIIDHFGHPVKWNLFQSILQSDFEKIKKQIIPL